VRQSKFQLDNVNERADIRKIEELEKFFNSIDWQAHEDRIKEAFRPKQQDVAERPE
jgi:hypothetical protein